MRSGASRSPATLGPAGASLARCVCTARSTLDRMRLTLGELDQQRSNFLTHQLLGDRHRRALQHREHHLYLACINLEHHTAIPTFTRIILIALTLSTRSRKLLFK